MSNIDTFKAINCGGAMIPNPDAVTAMCLLFDKIYLPNDLEIVTEFARKFRIKEDPDWVTDMQIVAQFENPDDPLIGLSAEERVTAKKYLAGTTRFIDTYLPLYQEVFESPCFPDGSPLEAELIEEGGPGELNEYRVSRKNTMQFRSGGTEEIAKLISRGYVPFVGKYSSTSFLNDPSDHLTSSQIANLLAMNAIKIILPRTSAASANTILEARDRLRNHLPPFWAAMLKLTRDLRIRIDEGMSEDELHIEANNLAEDTVRPALIELKHKMDLERKQWFFRILSPIQKGLRLLVGNPALTQQQLFTNAMVLGSDIAMSSVSHLQQTENLKNSSGLTMLLEADQFFNT